MSNPEADPSAARAEHGRGEELPVLTMPDPAGLEAAVSGRPVLAAVLRTLLARPDGDVVAYYEDTP